MWRRISTADPAGEARWSGCNAVRASGVVVRAGTDGPAKVRILLHVMVGRDNATRRLRDADNTRSPGVRQDLILVGGVERPERTAMFVGGRGGPCTDGQLRSPRIPAHAAQRRTPMSHSDDVETPGPREAIGIPTSVRFDVFADQEAGLESVASFCRPRASFAHPRWWQVRWAYDPSR